MNTTETSFSKQAKGDKLNKSSFDITYDQEIMQNGGNKSN